MKDCYLKARAYVDWLEFKDIVENGAWCFDDFCETYNGMNYDGELCDVNFKSICATVRKTPDGLKVDKYIEVWYDTETSYLGTWSVDELKKYIVED